MSEEITRMPAVALRGMTILPSMIVHFDVSRDKSIKAIEQAMTADQKLFVVTQRDPEASDPGIDDLYHIGTVVEIKQLVKLPKNIIRVLVEGLERAELLEMEVSAGYLDAKVATFPDVKDQDYPGKGDEVGQQAMIRNLKELFQKYAQANGKISQELVRQIMEIEDLEHLTDQIAIHIPLYYEEKQRILEAVFLYDRYEELCVILANEENIMRIKVQLQEKVKARIDKNQKEYILREQLKLIREELGDDTTLDDAQHFLEETEKLTKFMFPDPSKGVYGPLVGKSANWIGEQAGLKVPEKTKILIAPISSPDENHPLAKEKLSPVLAYFVVNSKQQGFDYANKMLELGGLGHSAVIHTGDMKIADEYGVAMRVGRIIVNSPSSQGAIGDIYNTNTPSLTLGCGSYGKNSVSQNVTTVNLINKKRIAKRRVNMQWFKVPPRIYFEEDSIQYLEKMEGISRAFIVTDPMMVKLGNVDKVLYYLRKREEYCHSEIYSDVESDPSVECIMRGVKAMNAFQPDVIIAIGGGSAIDAAKGMWLFYEHPDTSFDGLRQRFLDIRKRAFKFPKLGQKAKLVAIPTTSGTGSEVTSFSVITDKQNGNIKYPLADYRLTPDVAIIDPQFTRSMPKSIVADTGLDVLTHAIEAYVSVMASDYTDGLALHAIEMVFTYLEKSYNGDPLAREKMHNASCIAGMAFTNAFLGLNHSMAHKLGAECHIPHGRANAILLPYVIKYNATKPTKFASFPKYKEYVADERYAKIARRVGLCSADTPISEAVDCLVKAIRELMTVTERPLCIKDCGVSEAEFMSKVDELSYKAFEDQCTTANPVYPLVSEIKELYREAYYGE